MPSVQDEHRERMRPSGRSSNPPDERLQEQIDALQRQVDTLLGRTAALEAVLVVVLEYQGTQRNLDWGEISEVPHELLPGEAQLSDEPRARDFAIGYIKTIRTLQRRAGAS